MSLFNLPQPPQHSHGEGGGERWLISYADMITLLLVLFIILYSTAQQDLAKFEALSQSLSEGFGASTPNMAPIDNENTGGAGDNAVLDRSTGGDSPLEMFAENQSPIQIFQFAKMLDEGGELKEELDELVQEALDKTERELGLGELEGGITVRHSERGIVIEIHPDQILFDPGSAQLKPAFKEVLKVLAVQLARLPNAIEVQGHSDSLPISTAAYPSNWELSAARAGAVVRQLQNLGLRRDRLSAAGYADTRPLADDSTAAGRAKNRRVEILILRDSSADAATQPAVEKPAEAQQHSEPGTAVAGESHGHGTKADEAHSMAGPHGDDHGKAEDISGDHGKAGDHAKADAHSEDLGKGKDLRHGEDHGSSNSETQHGH